MRAALWPVTRPLTCEDLWRIREASAERLEIIDGELFATPPSTVMHQLISLRLSTRFDRAVGDTQLGEVFPALFDVRLADDTLVLPDIMIILKDRFAIIADWGIDGSPSLLAEITSACIDYRDRGLKKEIYALYGVPEYWIVEPDGHRVTVCSVPYGDRYRVETVSSDCAVSSTIPGLTVDLAKVFAPPIRD
jgi:Uma2 family endonuclease